MSEDDRDPDGREHKRREADAPEPTDEDGRGEDTDGPAESDASTLSTVRKALTVVLAIALVLSLSGVVYVAVTPQQTTDPYTEFYVLGPNGKAADYPTNLTVGERADVIVGVVNHEHREVTYTLIVTAGDRTLTERTLTVANGDTWERPVTYAIEETGVTRVQFLLYRGTDSGGEPYRSLRLWTNVTAPSKTDTSG